MILQIGNDTPDSKPKSTEGRIRFHDWIGQVGGAYLASNDFTAICTTEVGHMAKINPSSTSATSRS